MTSSTVGVEEDEVRCWYCNENFSYQESNRSMLCDFFLHLLLALASIVRIVHILCYFFKLWTRGAGWQVGGHQPFIIHTHTHSHTHTHKHTHTHTHTSTSRKIHNTNILLHPPLNFIGAGDVSGCIK
jgi:Ca2+/H+ antiporter